MGRVECEGCKTEYDAAAFADAVKLQIKDIYNKDPTAPKHSTHINCKQCQKPLVKPATVLYGADLPAAFFDAVNHERADVKAAKNVDPTSNNTNSNARPLDILFIAGTSLTVGPANCVPQHVSDTCLRVVINREECGDFMLDYTESDTNRDIFLQGDVEDVIEQLVQKLGWTDQLTALCTS
jgi:NAD-dependent SIR2 family protein deacetylase